MLEKDGGRLDGLKETDRIFNRHRGIADFGWCVFFIAALVGFGFITGYGYSKGNVWKLIAPVDGNHRICGFDKEVKDYKYLYVEKMDSVKPKEIFASAVCVKECPKTKTE